MPLGGILAADWPRQGLSPEAAVAESQASVTKSLVIMGCVGLAGCVMLSLLMKQAVTLQTERTQVPFLPAVAAKFAPQLAAPLRLREERTGGQTRLMASARLWEGGDPQRFAEALAAEIWLHVRRAGNPARQIELQVRVADGAPLQIVLPRPAPGR